METNQVYPDDVLSSIFGYLQSSDVGNQTTNWSRDLQLLWSELFQVSKQFNRVAFKTLLPTSGQSLMIIHACRNGHLDMLKKLLSNDKRSPAFRWLDYHVAAATTGQIEVYEYLKTIYDPLGFPDYQRQTASCFLTIPVLYNQLSMLQHIQKTTMHIDTTFKELMGEAAMYVTAVRSDSLDMLRYVWDVSPTPDSQTFLSQDYTSNLAKKANISMLEWTLDITGVRSSPALDGLGLFIDIATKSTPEMFALLVKRLEKNKDFLSAINSKTEAVLSAVTLLASDHERLPILRSILDMLYTGVTDPDITEQTLDCAFSTDNVEALKILLEYRFIQPKGMVSCLEAAKMGSWKCVELLYDRDMFSEVSCGLLCIAIIDDRQDFALKLLKNKKVDPLMPSGWPIQLTIVFERFKVLDEFLCSKKHRKAINAQMNGLLRRGGRLSHCEWAEKNLLGQFNEHLKKAKPFSKNALKHILQHPTFKPKRELLIAAFTYQSRCSDKLMKCLIFKMNPPGQTVSWEHYDLSSLQPHLFEKSSAEVIIQYISMIDRSSLALSIHHLAACIFRKADWDVREFDVLLRQMLSKFDPDQRLDLLMELFTDASLKCKSYKQFATGLVCVDREEYPQFIKELAYSIARQTSCNWKMFYDFLHDDLFFRSDVGLDMARILNSASAAQEKHADVFITDLALSKKYNIDWPDVHICPLYFALKSKMLDRFYEMINRQPKKQWYIPWSFNQTLRYALETYLMDEAKAIMDSEEFKSHIAETTMRSDYSINEEDMKELDKELGYLAAEPDNGNKRNRPDDVSDDIFVECTEHSSPKKRKTTDRVSIREVLSEKPIARRMDSD